MDTYQPIYDAVRSKLSGGDIGGAIESAIRDANIGHYAQQVASIYEGAASEQMRPCVLYKPSLYPDGDQWCALYGANLQKGVAGFGESPEEAMINFDKHWYASMNSAQQ